MYDKWKKPVLDADDPWMPYPEQSNSESCKSSGGFRAWGDEELTSTSDRVLGSMEILSYSGKHTRLYICQKPIDYSQREP